MWLLPVVVECLRAVAPFMEQSAMYNAINFDNTYSRSVEHDRLVHASGLPLLPERSRRATMMIASLGGTGYGTTSYGTCDGDWYV